VDIKLHFIEGVFVEILKIVLFKVFNPFSVTKFYYINISIINRQFLNWRPLPVVRDI
jgi:hypothetical protein